MWVRYVGFLVLVAMLAVTVLVVLRAQSRIGRGSGSSDVDDRHQSALRGARQQLKKAQRAHDKAVRRAEKAVTKAGESPVLVTCGPVTLTELLLTVRGRSHELSPSTTIDLDVQGDVLQVSGKDGTTRPEDRREVFLTFTDDAWGDVVKLPPSRLEDARRLLVAGEAAVRNLEASAAARDQRVAGAEAELDRVRADTGKVDAARMTVEDLEGAPPRRMETPEPPEEGQED